MTYHIDIQHASPQITPINDETLIKWSTAALASEKNHAEITLRIVDREEITHLNLTYRKQNKATNVLAFPADLPSYIQLDSHLLGDVILCAEVIAQESIELKKSLESHWALMIVHGILHLLKYDHIEEEDATIMQDLEIKLLKNLGFDNPYHEDQ